MGLVNGFEIGDRVRTTTSLEGDVIAIDGEYLWGLLECVGGDMIPTTQKWNHVRKIDVDST